MGQKINPNFMRLGSYNSHKVTWCAFGTRFTKYLQDDTKIRDYLNSSLKRGSISSIEIERPHSELAKVTINTALPGIVIGPSGRDIAAHRQSLMKITSGNISLIVNEIKKPDLDAQLVALGIAQQLEKRAAYRRVMKRVIQNTMRAQAKGVRVECSGRLNGAEIARREWQREGRVPLHTLRADIDYATAEALTTYGIIGIKVWIYKGEKQKIHQAVSTANIEDTGD
jgi:small subunit ribosomal protein S3